MRLSGFSFDVEVSNFEEDMEEKLPPKQLAEKLALGKALAVAPLHADALIIGADTFVVAGDSILGKPHTPVRAIEMLHMLSGGTHKVITGYAIIDTKSGTQIVDASVTEVTFRKLSSTEIEAYVASGEPLQLAGGYAIQAGAAKFVTRIEGDYYGVMGLPLAPVVEALQRLHGNAGS
jgi:septum formation protein